MDIVSIRLSVQRALLGHVTPNLRAVYIKCIDDCIQLIFYYDHSPSEEEQERADFADTEFIADFPSPEYKTDFQVITISYPHMIPKDGVCVYKRYES